jgi:hypothetical protein
MENLLMTISPMFCDRFQQELYNKLQSVQQQQQQITQPEDLIDLHYPSLQQQPVFTNEPTNTSNQTNKSDANHHTTTTTNDLNSFDELNNWIN